MISGEQIRQFREAKGWTLKQLAEKAGMHFLLLARIEKGTVKRMKTEQMAVLENMIASNVRVGSQPPLVPSVTTSSSTLAPFDGTQVLNFPISNENLTGQITVESHTLDNCAESLASWICTLDPTWANRLQIMKDERGFSTTQALSTCIAYVLEHDLHMVILKHDALEPSPWRRGEKMECPECHVLYTPNYPGQPYCGNSCAETYRKREAEQVIAT